MIKQFINQFIKGLAMGAANVIPGVSGGTIALITGIFERLINAIKSFNLVALKLLFKGKIKDFIKHTDLYFLIAVFLGIAVAIISLARLLEYAFTNYPILVWSFFFGLILASVFFVARRIDKWNLWVILFFIIGAGIALAISVLNPATENESVVYLMLCGVVGACSMILPGLSGSFVLLIMGNYKLVMIDSINQRDIVILIPVVIGAVIGLLAFSYILSWVFRKYKNQTIALLSGFILGSLNILWPWKEVVTTYLDRHGIEKPLQQRNISPSLYESINGENSQLALAIVFVILGIISIWLTEYYANKKSIEE